MNSSTNIFLCFMPPQNYIWGSWSSSIWYVCQFPLHPFFLHYNISSNCGNKIKIMQLNMFVWSRCWTFTFCPLEKPVRDLVKPNQQINKGASWRWPYLDFTWILKISHWNILDFLWNILVKFLDFLNSWVIFLDVLGI